MKAKNNNGTPKKWEIKKRIIINFISIPHLVREGRSKKIVIIVFCTSHNVINNLYYLNEQYNKFKKWPSSRLHFLKQ